ncbi:DNA-binding response regulator, NarL/FixJ family, contains REC and HTH domains [Amycolatopsis lurida]|uniref:LuxR family transcriptional regulator n=1 Tax=Amycolatopsis lurida NRRL 2430 TaxID=1460371 RepID=A0A2P2FG26_AMYLU|nr:response regulator transcription factor [Amycolatopsis lurida]KFU75665.1 LuxR family transcriptional regulator [Amycolatopsis lurida NRRL 2430]SEE31221.1 DNA-binding response regulator, NarL/FixJ family, contains REC and HTH domains [Amycolatopsis lurida]
MEPVRVGVLAADSITQLGLTSFFRTRRQVQVVDLDHLTEHDVLVVQADRMMPHIVAELCGEDQVPVPKVLLIDELRDNDVLSAVECGVVIILPRGRTSGDGLVDAVVAAASGRALLPPDLLGRLLRIIRRLQEDVLTPRGLGAAGLTAREVDVLRLMAEGLDTGEIAGELCYSERTVKNVISEMTSRLNLRNRPHAVAYAMQAGVI